MKALVGEDKVSVERMTAIPATFMTGVRYVSKIMIANDLDVEW